MFCNGDSTSFCTSRVSKTPYLVNAAYPSFGSSMDLRSAGISQAGFGSVRCHAVHDTALRCKSDRFQDFGALHAPPLICTENRGPTYRGSP